MLQTGLKRMSISFKLTELDRLTKHANDSILLDDMQRCNRFGKDWVNTGISEIALKEISRDSNRGHDWTLGNIFRSAWQITIFFKKFRIAKNSGCIVGNPVKLIISICVVPFKIYLRYSADRGFKFSSSFNSRWLSITDFKKLSVISIGYKSRKLAFCSNNGDAKTSIPIPLSLAFE